MFVRALDFWRIRNVTMNAELIKVMREQHKHYSTRQELEKRVNDIATLMSGVRTVTNATSPQPITQIIVSIMSEVTASSDVSINYFVAQAGWTAFYDLRASKENATIDLKHRAKVYQNTGLDWKNVSLVLSTGNPNQSNEKGSLNPFFIAFDQPVAVVTGGSTQARGYADGKDGVYKKTPSAPAPTGKPQEIGQSLGYEALKNSGVNNDPLATVNAASVTGSSYLLDITATADRDLNEFVNTSTNMLRVEYEITLKYTIESDNKPRNVIIQSKNIPTVYTYSVIPKLDLDVFLMARITDWEDMNLIPGEARIYFDNSFIGNTFINPQNINDTLQLNFGRDKSIVVSRTKVKDKCKEKFMNENKFSEKTYEIAIRNTKSMPIRVVVEDQMPVTRDPAIKIEYTENSNATKFNPETGKLTWDLSIKSKDTKKLVFKYEVKHPKDKVLSVF
jgi:hypothetical protein